MTLGLVRLCEVAFDGTRVEANNARHATRTANTLKDRLAALDELFEQTMAELDSNDAKQKTLDGQHEFMVTIEGGPEPFKVGCGEPLLNSSTPRFIRRAKRYLLRTGLSTSLSVRRFDAHAYVEASPDFMILSIDGATSARMLPRTSSRLPLRRKRS